MIDRLDPVQTSAIADGVCQPCRLRSRRRGSVLVLVMAVLGILFVIGIAFLSSIEFESNMARLARQRDESDASVTQVSRLSQDMLLKRVFPAVGKIGTATLATVDENDEVKLNRNVYTELPGLGLLSQLEPVHELNTGNHYFTYSTDLEMLLGPNPNAFSVNTHAVVNLAMQPEEGLSYMALGPEALNTDWFRPEGIGSRAPVDTDGDGIFDARQIRLTAGNLPSEELQALAEEVNDPALSDPEVYLGLRVIAHGGMVNLNDSHPALQRNVLSVHNANIDETFDAAEYINRSENRRGPYSPLLEEAPLRHRFMLPPRDLPVTAIQGDPLATGIDPPGGGDYGSSVFVQGQSLDEGYQYWMYGDDTFEDWSLRMDPTAGSKRDRRHLLTTISHEGQWMRGSTIELIDQNNSLIRSVDILDLFEELSEAACGAPGVAEPPFAFVEYPHPIVSGRLVSTYEPLSWCGCFDSPQCENDPRKGRLKLSLPWLDNPVIDANGTTLSEDQIKDLIYETFVLLLLNARSSGDGEFGGWVGIDDNNSAQTIERRSWQHQFLNISRAAAALTANMLDFVDSDDIPTDVAVRDFTFDDFTIQSCLADPSPTNCPLGQASATSEVFYGLERQPFITEIAVLASQEPETGGGEETDPTNSAYAVEILNPYDESLDFKPSANDPFLYSLHVGTPFDPAKEIILDKRSTLNAGQYYVVANEAGNNFGDIDPSAVLQSAEGVNGGSILEFTSGDVIYLLRLNPANQSGSRIVVDQFKVPAGFTLKGDQGDEIRSMQREGVISPTGGQSVTSTMNPWFAPLPATGSIQSEAYLGDDNLPRFATDPTLPVEVVIANTGSFATAFPTTGSLLLLMRHGNYIFGNTAISNEDKCFTSRLDGDDHSGLEILYTIDNGRMPVFDSGLELAGGTMPSDNRFFNSVNPAIDPTSNLPPAAWPMNRPGELMHLPWGQLVWDYFTALPLSNAGPYRVEPDGSNFDVAEDAQPRVDMDGLRVHGRININVAPWKVLAGLPYIPFENIPVPFQAFFDEAIGPFVDHKGNPMQDDEAGVLGEARARAIVDYRELRCGDPDPQNPNSCRSADFGGSKPFSSAYGRGWDDVADATNPGNSNLVARRGTGFLTIGELANVRGLGAGQAITSEYRMDAGVLNGTIGSAPSYLKAIAPLVCLGDWATVRSDVFTIYGTLRGAFPEMQVDNATSQELAAMRRQIDDRAIRFQETLDRLPIFMGDAEPKPIGNRTVGPYGDVVNN